MDRLVGKVAVVTGGSSGIGLATATLLAAEGATVFIVGRRAAELETASRAIGSGARAIEADVSNLDDLDRLWATVEDEAGAVDVIMANAGFSEERTLAESTPEHFDRTFDTNARGTFFTVQKGLPLLRDGGSVILVCSIGHLIGVPAYNTYCAAKAAVRSFARSWAAELAERGVRVNTLTPGPVDTPMLHLPPDPEEAEAVRRAIGETIPLGRLVRPEEVAKAALFLASEDSSFTTGFDLVVDGGRTQI